VGALVVTLLGIILAETVAMLVIYFVRDLPYPLQVLLDVTLMTIIIVPMLYALSLRPLQHEIRRRQRAESITQARLRLVDYAGRHSLPELLQYTLDEAEALTGSRIGFYHFLAEDEQTIWLQAWSTQTIASHCTAEGQDSHYDLERAGVWADAIRRRAVVIHNDYAGLAGRKGLPEGHAPVLRELVVPILRDQKVKAVLGVGNKAHAYTSDDVELVATLADFAWDVVVARKAELALRQSEEHFRTLADWTFDWEMWFDPAGDVVYNSPSCQRITGYPPEAFRADPALLQAIVHPADRSFYEEHTALLHDTSSDPVQIEYRIIDRAGNERWLEHICRPLFSPAGEHLGRRVSNREITERKRSEQMIVEQARKEVQLTEALRTIQTDIARDLHDTLGQNISFLRMNLEDLAEMDIRHPSPIHGRIQSMALAANESYELIRAMLALLQIGNSRDLAGLFARYAEQIEGRSGVRMGIASQGEPVELTPLQIRQLFYIFREALNNIEKHAGASKAEGLFRWGPSALTLCISDNGRGFDPQAQPANGHYGLQFMRERVELLGGSFTLASAPEQGTQIEVSVPYPDPSGTPETQPDPRESVR
jgi:PAS domain S-box-containing protein